MNDVNMNDMSDKGTTVSGTGWWKVLDGSMLKLLAIFTMLVDHTASILLEDKYITIFRIGTFEVELYYIMRLIGRLSFPLFAFLIVEGFLHTRNVKRYALNLLIFAVVSEIPWNLVHGGIMLYSSQNVMFTLLLGLLGIWIIRDYRGEMWRKALFLISLLVFSVLLRCDYGCSGFGFILMLYLLREHRLYQAIVGSCFLSTRWKAGIAFIPISMYNGRRGFISNVYLKYLFYLIYPVHLLILYIIRII